MKKLILAVITTGVLSTASTAEVGGNFKANVNVKGSVMNSATGNLNQQSIAIGSVQGATAKVGSFNSTVAVTGSVINIANGNLNKQEIAIGSVNDGGGAAQGVISEAGTQASNIISHFTPKGIVKGIVNGSKGKGKK